VPSINGGAEKMAFVSGNKIHEKLYTKMVQHSQQKTEDHVL